MLPDSGDSASFRGGAEEGGQAAIRHVSRERNRKLELLPKWTPRPELVLNSCDLLAGGVNKEGDKTTPTAR